MLYKQASSLLVAYKDSVRLKLDEKTQKKYSYDFALVCLLNALYGNPNVNLL